MVKIEDEDANEFSLTGLPSFPFGIEENDSVVFRITFKPVSEGDKTTKLKIYSNVTESEVELTGIGTPPYHAVSGEIAIDENTPVNDGWVLVHRWDNDAHTAWITRNFHLEGNNQFSISMREGEVTVYVYPDEEKYPGYLKTYLGNTAVFDEAEFFYLDHDTTGLEILLVPVPPAPEGSSTITGILTENGEGGRTTDGPCGSGTPVDSANVFLYDASGKMIAYAATTVTGEFVFENIPIGSYVFKADYTGYKMAPQNDTLIIS